MFGASLVSLVLYSRCNPNLLNQSLKSTPSQLPRAHAARSIKPSCAAHLWGPQDAKQKGERTPNHHGVTIDVRNLPPAILT